MYMYPPWFSVPDGVADLEITPAGDDNDNFLVTWSLPDDDGGSDILYVNITYQLTGIGDCNDTIMVNKTLGRC